MDSFPFNLLPILCEAKFINVPCARYIWYDFYSDASEHICARNFIPIVFRERALVVISWWSSQITKHIFSHCFCLFPNFHQHSSSRGTCIKTCLQKMPSYRWMYYHGVILEWDGWITGSGETIRPLFKRTQFMKVRYRTVYAANKK